MSASQHRSVARDDVELAELTRPEYDDPVLGKRHATPARLRARALRPPKLETVEEREDFIEGLMSESIWTPHTSRECQLVCAAAWDVEMTTVRDYSGAANRKLHARARDSGGMYATQALSALSTVAQLGCTSDLPGDKSAAVQASKELLKFAGLAEPDADKQQSATVFAIGTVITSPAMQMLVGSNLNALQSPTAASAPAEEADELPAADSHSPMVPRRDQRS